MMAIMLFPFNTHDCVSPKKYPAAPTNVDHEQDLYENKPTLTVSGNDLCST